MKWQKVLYKKTHFPDDYTDEKEFLSELKKNGTSTGTVQFAKC